MINYFCDYFNAFNCSNCLTCPVYLEKHPKKDTKKEGKKK